MTTVPRAPIKWAQRKGQLYLKIDQPDIKDVVFDVNEETNSLKVSGVTKDGPFANQIDFHGAIKKEGSMFVVHGKATEIIIMKAESGPHWPRLTKEKMRYHWLSVDWSRDIDEEDEDGAGAKKKFDLSGYDPSQMGDFMSGYDGAGAAGAGAGAGGAGDMGGAGGAGGMDPAKLQEMLASLQGAGGGGEGAGGAGGMDPEALQKMMASMGGAPDAGSD
eukprot:TRINITY_DN701_c0_g1_i1.p1 TRINITY_DN701_c0_g1~~TRINITY_DN701_c0_g1_i1.p1  ORF type:complete len:231 (-),score=78.04 TRINITY_DN701_c0_g1_i1:78-731(-)